MSTISRRFFGTASHFFDLTPPDVNNLCRKSRETIDKPGADSFIKVKIRTHPVTESLHLCEIARNASCAEQHLLRPRGATPGVTVIPAISKLLSASLPRGGQSQWERD